MHLEKTLKFVPKGNDGDNWFQKARWNIFNVIKAVAHVVFLRSGACVISLYLGMTRLSPEEKCPPMLSIRVADIVLQPY
jgi:hypothetical protein